VEGSIPQADHELALDLPSARASVTEARRRAARFAEAHGADRAAVELAVGEAVGNAVIHAYRGGAEGPIAVDGRVDGSALRITVSDHGVGMRPDPNSAGLGFGLPLIAQLTERVEITARPGGGTDVCMRFAIADAA
jgi:serine/threonine-protein kinase RsbW